MATSSHIPVDLSMDELRILYLSLMSYIDERFPDTGDIDTPEHMKNPWVEKVKSQHFELERKLDRAINSWVSE